MKLAAIAYPQMSEKAVEIIENFRKEHDSQYEIINPHYSFVFPFDGIPVKEFCAEIKKQVKDEDSIVFSTHLATIHKDELTGIYYTFLVPFHGHAQMIRLHDKLYSSKLAPLKKNDIKFEPHITLGNSTNKNNCQQMINEWNDKNIIIKGAVSSIDIIKLKNEKITTVEKIKLNQL